MGAAAERRKRHLERLEKLAVERQQEEEEKWAEEERKKQEELEVVCFLFSISYVDFHLIS